MMAGKKALMIFLSALLVLGVSLMAAAQETKEEASLKVQDAELVVKKMMNEADKHVPADLMSRAKAVAIFPGMFKAGFIVGGNFGRGVVVNRQADGKFGIPAFYTMGGASVGLQIGAASTDMILVIMTQKGLDGLLKNNFKLGADVGIAAGPVGRRSEAALTGASTEADVYSYSYSSGAFAGISLEGMVINYNQEMSTAYYGRAVTSKELLQGNTVKAPAESQSLADVLNHYGKP